MSYTTTFLVALLAFHANGLPKGSDSITFPTEDTDIAGDSGSVETENIDSFSSHTSNEINESIEDDADLENVETTLEAMDNFNLTDIHEERHSFENASENRSGITHETIHEESPCEECDTNNSSVDEPMTTSEDSDYIKSDHDTNDSDSFTLHNHTLVKNVTVTQTPLIEELEILMESSEELLYSAESHEVSVLNNEQSQPSNTNDVGLQPTTPNETETNSSIHATQPTNSTSIIHEDNISSDLHDQDSNSSEDEIIHNTSDDTLKHVPSDFSVIGIPHPPTTETLFNQNYTTNDFTETAVTQSWDDIHHVDVISDSGETSSSYELGSSSEEFFPLINLPSSTEGSGHHNSDHTSEDSLHHSALDPVITPSVLGDTKTVPSVIDTEKAVDNTTILSNPKNSSKFQNSIKEPSNIPISIFNGVATLRFSFSIYSWIPLIIVIIAFKKIDG